MKITGWMHSGELQRRAAGDAGWLARLRGRGRVLMGDINCDFRDENAEVRAWELDRSGFAPLGQQGAYGDVAAQESVPGT